MIVFCCFVSILAFGYQNGTPAEIPLPEPNTAAMRPSVRESLQRMRTQIDRVQKDPSKPAHERAEAFGNYGLLCHAMELEETALAAYLNARKLNPGDIRWPYFAGFLYKHAGQMEAARASYQAVLELQSDHPYALLRLGNLEIDLNRYAQAERYFKKVLALDPKSTSALFGLGRATFGSNRFAEAIDYFQKALSQQPEATSINYHLALAFRKQGDLDRARMHMDRRGDGKIVLADPHLRDLVDMVMATAVKTVLSMAEAKTGFSITSFESYILAELTKRDGVADFLQQVVQYKERQGKGQNGVELARLRYAIGILLRKRNAQDPRALAQFRSASETDPSFAEPRVALAQALMARGKFQAARLPLDDFLGRYPEQTELRFTRALIYLSQTNRSSLEKGIADLEVVVEHSPDHRLARQRLAAAYNRLDFKQKAMEQYEILLQDNDGAETKPEIHENLAKLYFKLGNGESALKHLRLGLALEPGNDLRRLYFAEMLGSLGRYPQAAREFEELVRLQPDNRGFRFREVLALVLGKNYSTAIEKLRNRPDWLENDGDWSQVLARLLALHSQSHPGSLDRAHQLAKRVHHQKPNPETALTLAMVLGQLEQWGQAISVLSEPGAGGGDSTLENRRQQILASYKAKKGCCPEPVPQIFLTKGFIEKTQHE